MPDETKLALLIQEGRMHEPEVIKALTEYISSDLYRLAWQLLDGTPERRPMAELLTEEALRAALLDSRRFRNFDTLRTWAYANFMRVYKRAPRLAKENDLKLPKQADLQENTALEMLSEQARQVILLHYGHSFSSEQAAVILHKSEKQVRKQLGAARKQLYLARDLARLYPVEAEIHYAAAIEAGIGQENQLFSDLSIQEHISACPSCQNYLNAYAALAYSLKEELSTGVQPDEQFLQALAARLSSDPASLAPDRSRLPFKEIAWVGIAFAVFLVLIRGANTYMNAIRPTPTPLPTATLIPATPLPEQFPNMDFYYTEAAAHSAPDSTWQIVQVQTIELEAQIRSMNFSPQGNFALILHSNLMVFWDLVEDEQLVVTKFAENTGAAAISPDEKWVATADQAGRVYIWRVPLQQPSFLLEHPGPVSQVRFTTDGSRLAVAHSEGVWVWAFEAGSLVRVLNLPAGNVSALAISQDEAWLASATGSEITIWQLEDPKPVLRFPAHESDIDDLQFLSAYNWRLASTASDRRINIYSFQNTPGGILKGGLIHTLLHENRSPRLASNLGSSLLSIDGFSPRLFNPVYGLGSEFVFAELVRNGVLQAGFIRDGEYLLMLDTLGELLWYRKLPYPNSDKAVLNPTFFERSEVNLLASDRLLDPLRPPGTSASELDLAELSELAGFPVQLPGLISRQYRFERAGFEAQSETAVLYFSYRDPQSQNTISYSIRQRPVSTNGFNDIPVGSDWGVFPAFIGQNVPVQPLALGGLYAEYIQGNWAAILEDNLGLFLGAERSQSQAIWYRWQPALGTRLRWQEANILFEIRSEEISSPNHPRRFGLDRMQQVAESMINDRSNAPTFEHIVDDGETCTQLASLYGTTIGAIQRTNQLDSCDLILAGQALLIPLPSAREEIALVDLDCDGVAERISVIPDPALASVHTNYGIIVERRLPGSGPTENEWISAWELTRAHIPVEFFGLPELFQPPGSCAALLAVTAFSNNDAGFGGLDIYRWNGAEMERELDAAGFLDGEFASMDTASAPFSFDTQLLLYDSDTVSCTLQISTYEWENGQFVQTGQQSQEGLECFENRP